MLIMTVMQHERGAVGGFSKDVAEDKEDVLSCLRHLHRTLQECHWRVQSVDHALCAQGNRGLDGPQNQTGKDHSFQYQGEKDCGPQNLSGRSILDETVKDCSFHDEATIIRNVAHHFNKFSEETNVKDVQINHEEDHNYGNEIKKELESGNLSGKEHHYQNTAQEKHSNEDTQREDNNLPLQDKDINLFNLHSDFKNNLPSLPTKDDDLQEAAVRDCTKLDHPEHDHCTHNQTKEERSLFVSTKSTCDLDCTTSLLEQQSRWSKRQDDMDDGSLLPVDFLVSANATVGLQQICRASSESETSAVPYIIKEDIQPKFFIQTSKHSEKATNETSPENCSPSSEVRWRPGHKEGSLGSEVCYERETDLLRDRNTSDACVEDKDKTVHGKKPVGNVSFVETFPEVTQKMDVIWEALENLQSHFLALHSSIVHSSSHCLNQKLDKSVDKSDDDLMKVDKVGEPSYLNEEHAKCKDEAGMLHQTTSEVTLPSLSVREETRRKKSLLRELPWPICHSLSGDYTRSCTLHQQPAFEASPSDSTAYRGPFRRWQDGCLFLGMVLVLLLLLLFLASCLLLVLPVVSVSVRTAGGLPAF